MAEDTREKVTIRIPPEIKTAIDVKASRSKRPAQELYEGAVEYWLEQQGDAPVRLPTYPQKHKGDHDTLDRILRLGTTEQKNMARGMLALIGKQVNEAAHLRTGTDRE